MRLIILVLLILLLPVITYPQVVVNEFSSSNQSGITDEDGDHSDWIEIFNNSPGMVNLEGYHLSDDASMPGKWTFPSVLLKPAGHLLVFASGKNRTAPPVSYNTIIYWNDFWKYLVPLSEQGDAWKDTAFDDSAWQTGRSGFGYGDNDDATVLENIVSVFIRKEFTITDVGQIVELVLSIDYNDGFVAYINGHEIARSNLGSVSPVPFNAVTGSSQREATMYDGGYPENFFINDPQSILREGVNVIAIQGHNSDGSSSDFSLIPMLSVGTSDAGESDAVPDYIQLKTRYLHTGFRISNEGETLLLTAPDNEVTDLISPAPMAADISYGRQPDGSNNWYYFMSPTPGGANLQRGYSPLGGDTVLFSIKGGYYPGGVNLNLSSKYNSDSIFYTTDGSEPSIYSHRYVSAIPVSGNMVIRAMSVNSSFLPGPVLTNTYVTERHTLPVVCLSTDPGNLWDYYSGIYANGPDASADFPYFGANFWMDWERKAHMELYDADGEKQIDQDIGVKIYGGWSRGYPQKSLSLFARSEYGKGSFDYKVFRDKPIEKYEALVLRNAGNDWEQAGMRDGLTTTLINDMAVDRLAFQPSVVYINGEYWGILNIREKINKNYAAENHLVDPESVNLLEEYGLVIEGTNTGYTALTDFLRNNTLEESQDFIYASNQIDIDNYIQYQLTEIYCNNRDWPGSNVKYWNTNNPGSKWRWIIYDTDFGYSIWEEEAYNFNTLSFALEPNGPEYPNPPWSTLIFRRMISNQGFRNEFATQYADRLNRNFSPERVNHVVDSIQNIYLPEIREHLDRWQLSYDNWQYNYGIIKKYCDNRPDYARNHLRSVLGLGEVMKIRVSIDDPGTGTVKVNSIFPYKYPFDGYYFKDLPVKLKAVPAPGYKFVKWIMGALESDSASLEYDMKEPRDFVAVFEPGKNSDDRIVINEINYISSPSHDTKDWVELFNAGNSTVNLKNWVISDGGQERGFTITSDVIFTPGMFYVICRDLTAFRQFWPDLTGATGNMDFGLSSSGDNVNLYDPDGNLVDFVNYRISSPWPENADLTFASIELIDPVLDNNNGSNWKAGIAGGTPGEINHNANQVNTDEDIYTNSVDLTCYPNPFSDYTTLRIEVSKAGKYRIEVFDLRGSPLQTISDKAIDPGVYYLDWNGIQNGKGKLPGGVYLVRLSGEGQQKTIKVLIIRH